MKHTLYDYFEALRIADSVCEAASVQYSQMAFPLKRSVLTSIVQGVCCVLSRDACVHPTVMAKVLHRTRANVINQARTYGNYIKMNDKQTSSLYKNTSYIAERVRLQQRINDCFSE